jgi:hypothetical protein
MHRPCNEGMSFQDFKVAIPKCMRRLAVEGMGTLTATLRPVHGFVGEITLAVLIFFNATHASFWSTTKLLRACNDLVILSSGLEKLR